jgi:hypothetical protein
MSERAPVLDWFTPAPPERLALLRILLGGSTSAYVLVRAIDYAAVARFPAAELAPVGPVRLLSAPLPAALVVGLVAATVLAGVAFTLGWRFRTSGPAFALLLLWITIYRNSWGMIFHTENLMVLHVLVLAIAPAAEAFSFDARGRPPPPASVRHGWPIKLMCAVTLATYFVAGVAKLKNAGLAWIWSDTLRNFVAIDNLRKAELGDGWSPIGAFMVQHPELFPPLAALAMVVELGAPLALLGRRVAIVWALLAWSFHVGVLVVMAIVFSYPLLGLAYAPMFRLERAWARLRRRADRS